MPECFFLLPAFYFVLGGGAFAGDEAAAEGQFGVGEAEGFLGDGGGDAGEFVEDHAGFDDGDVILDGAFALALADFGGFFRDWFVREYADPEFAFAFEVAGDGDAGGFDLASGHVAAGEGLESAVAKGHCVSALGVSFAGAFLDFAVFGACW